MGRLELLSRSVANMELRVMARSAVCGKQQHVHCEGYVIMHAGRHGDASKRYLEDCECSCHNA